MKIWQHTKFDSHSILKILTKLIDKHCIIVLLSADRRHAVFMNFYSNKSRNSLTIHCF